MIKIAKHDIKKLPKHEVALLYRDIQLDIYKLLELQGKELYVNLEYLLKLEILLEECKKILNINKYTVCIS